MVEEVDVRFGSISASLAQISWAAAYGQGQPFAVRLSRLPGKYPHVLNGPYSFAIGYQVARADYFQFVVRNPGKFEVR